MPSCDNHGKRGKHTHLQCADLAEVHQALAHDLRRHHDGPACEWGNDF